VPSRAWCALLAGYALAWRHPFPPDLETPCRLAAVVAGAAALLLGAGRERRVRAALRSRAEAALGLAALALAGAALLAEADRAAQPLPVHPRPIPVEVEGRVIGVEGATADAPWLLLEADTVRVGGRGTAAHARLLLRFRDPDTAPGWALPGLSVLARGLYRPPEDARVPGGFASGRWQERAGLAGSVECDPTSIRLLRAGPRGGDLPATLRARIGRAADGALSAPTAALLRGMLLGDRAGIAPAIEDAFRDGGTIHVLSISGLHVCILAGLAAFACAALRLPAAASAGAELAALWSYVLFVGAPAPAVRSAVLWTALRGARLAGRTVRPLTAWGIAGLLVHLADPAAPLDAGFQLSFAAVLGLLASAGLTGGGGEPPRARPGPARVLSAVRGLAGLLLQSAGAEAATLGLQVTLFGAVPVAGILLNLAIVPLCSLFLAQAVVYVGAELLAPPLAPLLAAPLEATGLGTVALTRWAAGLAPAWPVRAAPSQAGVVAALALLLLAACAREGMRTGGGGGRRRPAAAGAGAMLLAAALPLVLVEPAPAADGALRVVMLDVGQGDGIYALLPGGGTLLFDAGPVTRTRDAGRNAVEPALRAEGVRRADAAVLSHAHADHHGGFPWLARRGWIGCLVENGSPGLGRLRPSLRRSVEASGGRWTEVARDTTLLLRGGARLEILPAARAGRSARTSNAAENNRSLVVRLHAGGRVVLLPGDAEAEAERALAARVARADVLKASHHGSATSSDTTWLAAARPRVALISCGEGNRFGHPATATLGRFALAGTCVYRTDREGTIRLTSDAEGLWVSTLAHPDPERIAEPSELR
jgi:competence protein ComEC